MNYTKPLLLLIASIILLTGCGPTYTPEQIAQMQKQRMEIMEKYRLQLAARQVSQQQVKPKAVAVTPVNSPSETVVAAQISAVPMLPEGTGVMFKRNVDGFTANGERFTDYEGEISHYAFDGFTGNVTYLAKIDDMNAVIKFVRVAIEAEPITIATAIKSRGSWKITTTTGKKLSGSTLLMTSKGFVLVRRGAGFYYEPGKGVVNIAAPQGYRLAKYQTGDIASTRNILVEKLPKKTGSFGGLFAATKALGGVFGGEGNQDYALLNIDTKKMTPLFISYTGDENLYNYHGQGVKTKNSGHYYWRTEWFKVPSGTYVVYVVNGIKSAKVIHLETGLEKVIFERMLGISSVNSFIQTNGKIKVVADMGFGTEVVDDLEDFMTKKEVVAEE